MAGEANEQLLYPTIEEVGTLRNLTTNTKLPAEAEQEPLQRKLFGLALALATEPSKLGQLRHMLVHLQEEGAIAEDFSSWAIRCVDERVMSMALEYAHDAEVMLQLLSFKGGTFCSLTQDIEDLYRRGQITQRVYVKARLLLSAA
jgi:hypothetical protein